MTAKNIVLAISGASGAVYGKDIFDRLLSAGVKVHLIITGTAEKILTGELDIDTKYFMKPGVTVYDNADFETAVASGSFLTSGMVIAPASMACIGRIASASYTDLVGRAADVSLKEKRPLILVPRETPLTSIHLENMLKLSRAGATIIPAMPAFTHRPRSVEELAAFISGRVFDHLGLPQDFTPRYSGGK